MNSLPVTPDAAKFVARVLQATRRDLIGWETTADPNTLVGTLEGNFSIRLEEVSDLDGNSEERDFLILLYKGRQLVLRADRTDLKSEDLSTELKEPIKYSHQVFDELWKRAYLKAHKITAEINEANRILQKMINDDIPF